MLTFLTICALTFSNFIYQLAWEHDYQRAFERSFFQATAILIFRWILRDRLKAKP